MLKLAYWIEQAGHTQKRWTDFSSFRPGQYILSSLVEISRKVDAAIVIFGEDDQVEREGIVQPQTRDNVLIEYGIFVGTLGAKNTMIARKGKSKIPTDLEGLNRVELDNSVSAELQIKDWLKGLEPKNRLKEIRDIIPAIEKPRSKPFQSWLCVQHSKAMLRALEPMVNWEGGRGSFAYTTKVGELLATRVDTILALCGRKFKKKEANETYFSEFYEFARQRQARGPTYEDGIYVCRIFVEEENGALPPFMDEEFARHQENWHTGGGVLGLTIKADKRSHLDTYIGDGFSKCLDEGFGFLLFYNADGISTVIIHEGTEHDLAFVEMRDDLNIRAILDIHKILCRESQQYQPSEEKMNLKALMSRLQLPPVR